MQFALVGRDRIAAGWPVYAEMLAPAIQHDPAGVAVGDVYTRLMTGQSGLIEASGERASGVLVFTPFMDGGELHCFASYLAGRVDGGPKAMISTMRNLMAQFEQACRTAGVRSVFIGGRDWGRVFPDYELTGDVPNRRQKRL